MPTLTIRHQIPVRTDSDDRDKYITFYKWLPDKAKECAVRERDEMIAKLWVDESCASSFEPMTKEGIKKRRNVLIDKVYVDVDVNDVPDEIVKFIYDERDSLKGIHHGIQPADDNYEIHANDYREIGKNVQELALDTYNRFVQYVRNHKAQYWLSVYSYEENSIGRRNNQFNPKVIINDEVTIKWWPDFPLQFTLGLGNESRYIKSDDWSQLLEFVSSDTSPKLVLELLANAENLLNEGFGRSSLIELVAALELALFNMAREPSIQDLKNQIGSTRIDLSTLKREVRRFGLTRSMLYLIPQLFTEDMLPVELLNICNDAIRKRGNVVHGGQRNVNSDTVRTYSNSIRTVCEIFMHYTDDSNQSSNNIEQ